MVVQHQYRAGGGCRKHTHKLLLIHSFIIRQNRYHRARHFSAFPARAASESPWRMPNFCLCGTVGIHTRTSIKNPTKEPTMKPHKKSRSVPTLALISVLPLLRHKASLFIPAVILAILLVMLLIIKLLACQLALREAPASYVLSAARRLRHSNWR
jgi:hypothetical protein